MKHRCFDGIVIILIILAIVLVSTVFIEKNFDTVLDAGEPVQALQRAPYTPTTSTTTTLETATSTTTPTPSLKSQTLKIGQSFSYNGTIFTFTDVTANSRCPDTVDCIWAGEFIALVKLTKGTSSEIISVKEYATSSTALYTISIVEAKPFTTLDQKINKKDYLVTFLVGLKK